MHADGAVEKDLNGECTQDSLNAAQTNQREAGSDAQVTDAVADRG